MSILGTHDLTSKEDMYYLKTLHVNKAMLGYIVASEHLRLRSNDEVKDWWRIFAKPVAYFIKGFCKIFG